jgi:pyruvate/2-oxoglutarate dehydrogenase complex dihydrolipoamide acyltransferase (E2) component
MTTGILHRWQVHEGSELDDMEVAFEVQAKDLTDDPEESDDVTLAIELHEEGYIAKLLLKQGDAAAPDEAIAVVVNDVADVARFRDYPTKTRPLVEPGTFAWQAYLASEPSRQCSNS